MAERISIAGWAARVAAGAGAVALGLTGIGAAGALPADAQLVFDDAIATVQPVAEDAAEGDAAEPDETEPESPESDEPALPEPDEDDVPGAEEPEDGPALPVGSTEFSSWVREGAKDPDKVGRDFGASVSEQARELRAEKAAERAAAGEAPDEAPADDGATDDGAGQTTDEAAPEQADDRTTAEKAQKQQKPSGPSNGQSKKDR